MSTLKESFPRWAAGGGIFAKMESEGYGTTFPWLAGNASQRLDMLYFGNYSGNKTVSPYIDALIAVNADQDDPRIILETEKLFLVSMIAKRYSAKWGKLYAVLNAEYNPIENYNMYQKETPDITHKHSVSNDYGTTDTKTLKRDITRTESATEDFEIGDTKTLKRDITRTESATEDFEITDERKVNVDTTVQTDVDNTNSVYGFNSSAAVKANELDSGTTVHTTGLDTANKETNTRNQTGGMTTRETADEDDNVESNVHTQTGGMSTRETADPDDNIESITHTQTGHTEDKETGTRELERSGNIGVTTTQQMLESEVALWQWEFFIQVFKDVDDVLAIPVYELNI